MVQVKVKRSLASHELESDSSDVYICSPLDRHGREITRKLGLDPVLPPRLAYFVTLEL